MTGLHTDPQILTGGELLHDAVPEGEPSGHRLGSRILRFLPLDRVASAEVREHLQSHRAVLIAVDFNVAIKLPAEQGKLALESFVLVA